MTKVADEQHERKPPHVSLYVLFSALRAAYLAELAAVVPASPQTPLIEPKLQDAAERRQVTVMFSDLVRFDGTLGPHGPREPARLLNDSDIVMPSAFAVWRLIMSWNLVGA